MSTTVKVSIPRDTATAAVNHLLNTCTVTRLTAIVGPPLVDLTQKHVGAYRNQKGWPSTGFGEQAANKTYFAPTSEGPLIVIHAQGARQLYRGGPIQPVNKKRLVFAIDPESYGKTMREMGYRPKREGGDPAANKRIRSLFAFSKGVTQPPHPDFIPSPEAYGRAAIGAISEAIRGGAA